MYGCAGVSIAADGRPTAAVAVGRSATAVGSPVVPGAGVVVVGGPVPLVVAAVADALVSPAALATTLTVAGGGAHIKLLLS